MVLSLVIIVVVTAFFYMRMDKFGQAPSGGRLALVERSSHYKDGEFQNIHETPTLEKGYSYSGVIYKQLFKATPRRYPVDVIPSVKNDLLHLPPDSNVLVWFGHSSYFIQIDGKRILVDPVFSGNASPIPGTVPSFKGTDIYTVADLPDIDYLLISHDHYDHLDYETILQLKDKTRKVICGLGVGEDFERWGYPADKIIEKDWYQQVVLDSGFIVHTETARHFSGRGLKRNNTLWMSYLIQTPTMKIYVGGDSGYDTHFAEIGKKHGPIDLAIVENGQYNVAWHYIHTLPEETLKAGKDLKAKRLFPVHSSKFVLASHAWDEPLKMLTEFNKSYHIPLVTPVIGEIVRLKDTTQEFKQWWVGVN